jgi:nucleotide-binding universal stress UspA family protein
MYRHILLPTDGSALSAAAVESGVLLAKALGARVTGLHVMPKYKTTPLDRWVHPDARMRARLNEIVAVQARQYASVVATAAKRAGVPHATVCIADESPAGAIVRTAEDKGCDLIYMASHGRSGTSALLLGSETAKVLIQSPIPVLIHRSRTAAPIATRVSPALRTQAATQ